jgi:hypothetical protein
MRKKLGVEVWNGEKSNCFEDLGTDGRKGKCKLDSSGSG